MFPEFSRSRLARWARGERVTLSGRPAPPRRKVRGGERITLRPLPDPQEYADVAGDTANAGLIAQLDALMPAT